MSGHIRTVDLRKDYIMGEDVVVHALARVDLGVEEGEFLAVMGPSGAGKSTLMHILGLLDTPTAGTVFVGGRDVARLTPVEQADFRLRHLGFVFQSFNLLAELSALENVMLPGLALRHAPRPAVEARARDVLSAVGLPADQLDLAPAELSGGDQQRTAIARALLNEPDLILADEPTANVDSGTAIELLDLLRRLTREGRRTVVMVTHEEEWGARADRIVRLVDGRLA